MKRTRAFLRAMLVTSAVLAAGCSDNTGTAPTPNDPLVAKIISLGFRRDMIEDRGDHFIVEGDIRMSKRDIAALLEESRGLRPDFQWRTTNLVGQSQVQTINVSLAALSTQPLYQTAMRQAIVEWNRVNCSNVRFVEAGSPTHIRVVPYNVSSGTAALAKSPSSSGLPGDTVWVNLGFTGPNSDLVKKRNMAHELGHTIGFRHTNWQGIETAAQFGGAIQIPGTPQTDGGSVMNAGTAGTAWSGFSGYDNKATATLYPSTSPAACIRPNLSGPTTAWPYSPCTWRATPTGGTPPYSYSWMGTAPVLNGSVFRYSSGSSFTVSVTVIDANGRREGASQGVTVYQYGPGC